MLQQNLLTMEQIVSVEETQIKDKKCILLRIKGGKQFVLQCEVRRSFFSDCSSDCCVYGKMIEEFLRSSCDLLAKGSFMHLSQTGKSLSHWSSESRPAAVPDAGTAFSGIWAKTSSVWSIAKTI